MKPRTSKVLTLILLITILILNIIYTYGYEVCDYNIHLISIVAIILNELESWLIENRQPIEKEDKDK